MKNIIEDVNDTFTHMMLAFILANIIEIEFIKIISLIYGFLEMILLIKIIYLVIKNRELINNND